MSNLTLLPLLAACFLWSCTTERDPCLQPQTVSLTLHSYRYDSTGAIGDSALPNLLLIPIGSAKPVFFTYGRAGGLGTSSFSLQLSELADTNSWIIRPDSAASLQDTVTFYYQRQLHFISNACGYTYYFNLNGLKSTYHALDSIFILNPSVTNVASVLNIKVVY